MEIRTLNNAKEWFKLQNIDAFIQDGSIYVICGDGFELELSKEEIDWRSQLFVDYINQNN